VQRADLDLPLDGLYPDETAYQGENPQRDRDLDDRRSAQRGTARLMRHGLLIGSPDGGLRPTVAFLGRGGCPVPWFGRRPLTVVHGAAIVGGAAPARARLSNGVPRDAPYEQSEE
jgi:hypothetical protein